MIAENGLFEIERVAESKLQNLNKDELTFGKTFADHMLVCDFNGTDWETPRILPYQNIVMSPATSFIHYGQSIFEGLKAHKNKNGEVFLFRADKNLERINNSAVRICMPPIKEEIFMEGILELLRMDRAWIPDGEDSSMYIRPFMFGTDDFLGVKPSDRYRFMIINSPSGSYYKKPVKVKIETHFTRAAAGGVGAAKTAGNYAASLYPFKLAQQQGFDQLIWTDSREHKYIEESGTMNIMFVIDGKLITPQLTKTILPGITRDSILTICKHWGMEVEERLVSVDEIVEAGKKGLLQEAFGVGTAATIAQIESVTYENETLELLPLEERKVSTKIGKYLNDYKRGYTEDVFNWLIKV